MKRSRWRSLIGTNASTIFQQLRARNISVCAAMTKNCIIIIPSKPKIFNTTSFNVFLFILIEILRCKNMNNVIFVMDNVHLHKSITIRNYILSNNYHILYLSPYSPFLNPIENLFA
ncbi:hypothetical protein DMUE_3953 [Dictyocoela muelleri]|nr:hypothetical protein DMUE_3953 [Dictyocoela muelleri]